MSIPTITPTGGSPVVYRVMPFSLKGKKFTQGESRACKTEVDAMRLADSLVGRYAGVMVFSQIEDPSADIFVEPTILKTIGNVPEIQMA